MLRTTTLSALFLSPLLALAAETVTPEEQKKKSAKPSNAATPAATTNPEENAAPDAKPATLPGVVVTATRGAGTTALEAPVQVRQLDSQTMAERQVRSLPEALREIPGVNVQKTSNGQGSPYIRGFTGFRNLALIDGIRFNNSTFREGPNQYWSTIDQYAIDRLELVPGQGGVLYGSDSVGGTLNLHTKNSGFMGEGDGFFFHGLADFRASTAENSGQEHLEFQFGEGGKWGLHVGGSLKQFNDVRAADVGNQPYTGYDEWAYDIRLDVALDPNWTLTAAHQQLRQNDVWRTHATVFGKSWEGTTVGTDLRRSFDQERTLSYLRLEGRDLPWFIDAASFTVSFQTADEYEHRIRRPADNRMDRNTVELSTLGLDLQFQSNTPIGRLTYGADYYHDWVSTGSQRFRRNGTFVSNGIQGPVGDDANYSLLGIFLQDELDVGNRTHFYLGGRFTHAEAQIGRYQDPGPPARQATFGDEWDDFSLSGRVVVDLDEKDRYKAFFGVSQAFRSPNLSDLTRLDSNRTGETEVPSPGLSPEEYLTFELGLKAETENWGATASYFYTAIDNMITRRPIGGGEVIKANSGDGYVHGLEFTGDYRFTDQWSVFGNLTLTQGKVDQYPYTNNTTIIRENLSRVVPVMARVGVRWQSTDRKLWSELVCLAHSRADKLNSGDVRDTDRMPPGGTPGFALVTLRGGWQVTKNVGLTLALENLLNEDYRYNGSGSNEPGFGAVFGATVKF